MKLAAIGLDTRLDVSHLKARAVPLRRLFPRRALSHRAALGPTISEASSCIPCVRLFPAENPRQPFARPPAGQVIGMRQLQAGKVGVIGTDDLDADRQTLAVESFRSR